MTWTVAQKMTTLFSFFKEDDMDDMNCTPENEDDLEAAEMRFLQKQLELDTKNKESQEEKDYKAEFFELLDEVKVA